MPPLAHLLLGAALAAGAARAGAAGPERAPAAERTASPRAIASYLEARRRLLGGDDVGAIAAFRLALAHDEASPELHASLAEALALSGRLGEAEAEARRAIALARGGPAAVEGQVLLGRIHAARGERAKAIGALREAVRRASALADAGPGPGSGDPPDPTPWRLLAERYQEAGDPAAAARTLEELAARAPGDGAGFRELGRALAEEGALARAEPPLRRAVELDPGDLEALRLLADVHARQRRDDAARADLEAILAVDPDDAGALLGLGGLALRADDLAAARRLLARHVEAARDPVEARVRVAYAWLDAGRAPEALAVAREGGDDPDPRLRLAEGLALQDLRRWGEAAAALGAVRPSAGDLWISARVSLAYVLSRAGRNAAAEGALAPALAAHPAEVRLVTMRAFVLERAGRSGEAIALLRRTLAARARAHAPAADLSALHEALAESLARAGRVREALAGLRGALAAHPRDATLRFALGTAYDRAGRPEAALAEMKALLAQDPDHAEALNFVGYAYAERGIRLEEAEALVRRALEVRPRSGYILDTLGWIHFRRGDYARAVELLEQADALVGPDATVLEHLGDAYRAAARAGDAAGAYRRALASFDDESPVERRRTRAALTRKLRLLDTHAARL